ncbi:MAG TPA: Fic family protein [Candidatus Limnocylindrales bacterium]|nr:Fic family protein [Candidatus Limnocylindrales bacterium]
MRYRLTRRALTKPLADLEQRRWLFDSLPIDPTHAAWMRRRAWVRTIHGTARIEGNTASDVEVEALLAGEGATKISDKEAREIIGTRDALTLADELAATSIVPDEAVIRELHRRVLRDQSSLLTPGQYRRGENRVIDAGGQPVFKTPPSGDVPELMRAFAAWLGTATDRHAPPVVAALAHLEFVAIHPFNDGNGRTARAIARLILVRHGYAFGGLVSLDAQLDLDRPAYFAAIREAIGEDYVPGYDATPFARYFVTSIVHSADHVLARLRGLGEVMVEIRRAIADGSLPPAMIDGLAYAWVNRHLRAGDYIRLTGRSPQSTTRDLGIAAKGGWLRATGERRGRYYVLGPALLTTQSEGEIVSPSI